MENIFDYLKWYGNLSFLQVPFNEVDNACLCLFSYLKLENYITYNKKITLKDLIFKFDDNAYSKIFSDNQRMLVDLLKKSERFLKIEVTRVVSEVIESEEKQFGAVTFILNDKELFVAFRGTDESVVGWKENLNLSYMDIIPSQRRAAQYLNDILKNTNKNVYVGGHSKGGNLALFASIYCDYNLKNKIVKVYNNDGPGLKNVNQEQFIKIKDKIITFIPRESIIGNIFTNDTRILIVKSNSIGILEHNLYSWCVSGSSFVYSKEVDYKTKEWCLKFNEWLDNYDVKKKEAIISFLYDICKVYGITNIEDALRKIIKSDLWKKYKLSNEDFFDLKKWIFVFLYILKSVI